MSRSKIAVSLFALFLSIQVLGQVGGTATWSFLNLTNSARVASLGGKIAAFTDGDLNLAYHNPALLTDDTHNHLVMNYASLFSGVNYGYVAYARHAKGIGNFSGGIHYINYGTFTAADETGLITGSFTAAEYALYLTCSRNIDSCWTAGITLKPVYSSLERYQAFGMAADLGIAYTSKNRLFTAAMALRNAGIQFRGYYTESREPLPFEIIAGVARKLEHAPFRFLVTLHQLQRFNLSYQNPEDPSQIDPLTGKPLGKNRAGQLADQLMRHAILGVEFVPSRNFYLQLGYNYQRRKEMMIDARPGMVGFSWGFGFRISRFHFSYGRASWHMAGGTNYFSLSTNFSEFGFLSKTTQP